MGTLSWINAEILERVSTPLFDRLVRCSAAMGSLSWDYSIDKYIAFTTSMLLLSLLGWFFLGRSSPWIIRYVRVILLTCCLYRYVLLPVGKYCTQLAITFKGYTADSLCYYREPGQRNQVGLLFQLHRNILLFTCNHKNHISTHLEWRGVPWKPTVKKYNNLTSNMDNPLWDIPT